MYSLFNILSLIPLALFLLHIKLFLLSCYLLKNWFFRKFIYPLNRKFPMNISHKDFETKEMMKLYNLNEIFKTFVTSYLNYFTSSRAKQPWPQGRIQLDYWRQTTSVQKDTCTQWSVEGISYFMKIFSCS